jgi:hypothetical protein
MTAVMLSQDRPRRADQTSLDEHLRAAGVAADIPRMPSIATAASKLRSDSFEPSTILKKEVTHDHLETYETMERVDRKRQNYTETASAWAHLSSRWCSPRPPSTCSVSCLSLDLKPSQATGVLGRARRHYVFFENGKCHYVYSNVLGCTRAHARSLVHITSACACRAEFGGTRGSACLPVCL